MLQCQARCVLYDSLFQKPGRAPVSTLMPALQVCKTVDLPTKLKRATQQVKTTLCRNMPRVSGQTRRSELSTESLLCDASTSAAVIWVAFALTNKEGIQFSLQHFMQIKLFAVQKTAFRPNLREVLVIISHSRTSGTNCGPWPLGQN